MRKWSTYVVAVISAIVFFFSTVSIVPHAQSDEKKVIITYKQSKAQTASVQDKKLQVKHQFKQIPAVAATVPTSEIQTLKKDPNVLSVEEDKIVKLQGQTLNWGITPVQVPYAWHNGFTGRGVKVAVIDSGVYRNHSDLALAGGVSVVSYTKDYDDDNGHGTHVAGIIGAKDNNIGVEGVAPDAQLYAVKAFNANGDAYVSDVIAGIEWAISNKMDIINLSSSMKDSSPALQKAVDKAYQSGILLVGAAGNIGNAPSGGSTVEYPALYDSVIAVSAVDNTNSIADFSATGPKVEVTAPGVRILSTYPGNGYSYMSGTSMATPFVSGVLALLKQAHPTYSNKDLRSLLDKTAKDIGTSGRDSLYGYGLVQAMIDKAVAPVATPISPITQITLRGKASFYNEIGSSVAGYLNQPYVYAFKSQNGWYRVHTPLGSKWIYPNGDIPGNVVSANTVLRFDEKTALRDSPFADAKVTSYMKPQTVTAFESWNGWYHIHLGKKDKWISGTNAKIQ
ncbi:S8 family serine peptidase [Microbacteriaceae bacterium 4G12]